MKISDRAVNYLLAAFLLILFAAIFFLGRIQFSNKTITVIVKDVTGINAGITKLRYKGLILGTVSKITADDEFKSFSIKISLKLPNKSLMSDRASYWVQTPVIGYLITEKFDIKETFIAVSPEKGKRKTKFIALNAPPNLATKK